MFANLSLKKYSLRRETKKKKISPVRDFYSSLYIENTRIDLKKIKNSTKKNTYFCKKILLPLLMRYQTARDSPTCDVNLFDLGTKVNLRYDAKTTQ